MSGLANVNGTHIWYDDQGERHAEAVIMIPGAGARGDFFGDGWCAPIVASGYRIIRIDNRDIGRSEWIDFDRTPYTLETMAQDIIALMDVVGIATAHLVGNSMGGMIAQLVAIQAPARMLSLTCQASGPVMPMPGPEILAIAMAPRANTREAKIAHALAFGRALNGTWAFDETAERSAIERELDTEDNPNHHHPQVAIAAPDRSDRLVRLATPTLWINGTEDPLFPFERTRAIAEAMPNALLLPLPKAGHRLPRELLPQVTNAIVKHMRESTAR